MQKHKNTKCFMIKGDAFCHDQRQPNKKNSTSPESKGVKVTDLSIPGWVSNTVNGQQLMDRVRSATLPSDAVLVLVLLGNSSVRFRQADKSSSLTVKLNGHNHLLGDLEVMGSSHIESAFFSVSHLYKQYIKSNDKIFLPPIPCNVFGSCCFDLGHGEKMLSEHCRIRQSMKSTLLGYRVSRMRVLDTLGCLTNSSNPPEQLAALKQLTTKDNVHLTDEGYKALAVGLLKEATSLSEPRERGKTRGTSASKLQTGTVLSTTLVSEKLALKVVGNEN
jgi:hypothetical protein